MTTLERYGREHFSRISKGRSRRARYTPRKDSAVVVGKGETEGTTEWKQQ
jgi:hypothetical protein